MKKALLLLPILLITGCNSLTTVTEFDDSGNIVKVTKTSESVIKTVTESTKNKTVVFWSNGWAAYMSVSLATIEDPTPTTKIFAGKVAKGYISMLENQQNADKISAIISATREGITIDSTGIKSQSTD